LGASELAYLLRDESNSESGIGGQVPEIDAERNLAMYRALTDAMSEGLVASAHDCSDGGLAAAVAECCFGSDSGATINLTSMMGESGDIDSWGALFGESLGRIVVSVKSTHCEAFEAAMGSHACHALGTVEAGDKISFKNGDETILSASMAALRAAWKGTLDGGGPQ
jgi:phosphoribosylformylglycinamidine synthase